MRTLCCVVISGAKRFENILAVQRLISQIYHYIGQSLFSEVKMGIIGRNKFDRVPTRGELIDNIARIRTAVSRRSGHGIVNFRRSESMKVHNHVIGV